MTGACRRRVAVLIARLGPYHVARMRGAAAALGQDACLALEVASESREYAWDRVESTGFARRTLITDRDYQDTSVSRIAKVVKDALEEERPDAVAVPGWGYPEARAALMWCRRNGRIAIVMSDSQVSDAKRGWFKEGIKRRILSACDAAFVGGRRHADYLARLGFDRRRIVTGYDVVDNEFFRNGAETARRNRAETAGQRDPKAGKFLASARFIPKKNLDGLIEAFALYRRLRRSNNWDLVVLGDGPLKGELERRVSELGVGDVVTFPGFRQYGELPAFYAAAQAFVLPSTSEQWGLVVNEAMASGLPVLVSKACGSAELVEDGVNGYVFDPCNREQIARIMEKMTERVGDVDAMGKASQRIIANFGPERFGTALAEALALGEEHAATRRPRVFPNPALWI